MKQSTTVLSLLILIIAASLLLAGCSGTEGPKSPPAPGNTEKPVIPGGADAPQAAGGTGSQESASADTAFKTLFGKRASLQWKVDYDMTTQAQGERLTTKLTQYMDGTSRMRMDMTANGVESRTYFVSDVFTTCSKQNAAWTCYKIDTAQQKDPVKDIEKDLQTDTAKYEILNDGSRTIAGVNAMCYIVKEKGTTTAVNYCFSSDGIPLYVRADGAAEGQTFMTEMTATSFSKSVSASDFTPPAAAQDLGTMGGAGGTAPAGSGADNPCAGCAYLSGEQRDQCLAAC